jgi:hypothetical protein
MKPWCPQRPTHRKWLARVPPSLTPLLLPLQIFFSVYEMAIDTILLSFCEDCETNNGAC